MPLPYDIHGRRPPSRGGSRDYAPFPSGGGGAAEPSLWGPPSEAGLGFPPTYFRPPGAATDFYGSSGTAGVSLDNASSPVLLASFQLPVGQVGSIRSVAFSVNQLTTASRIRWFLRADGSPVPGWTDRTVFPRTVTSFSDFTDFMQLVIPAGSLIEWFGSVDAADAATYQAGLEFTGWYYDERIQQAYNGQPV